MTATPLRARATPIFALLAATAAGCARPADSAAPRPMAAAPRHVTLLHVADMHAQLDTHWEYMPGEDPPLQRMGGFARIRTVLDRERGAAPPAVFTVDGGDTFQGSAVAAWTEGEAILAPLNALGIDVGTPGNWEVVYGPERFRALMRGAGFRVLAYNFHDAATGERLFPPSAVLERGGVRVAFVGITDATTTQRQPPDQVRGLDSTRMAGLRAYVQGLRARERPDLTVAVTHTGITISRQLARDIPEFDVVLSGHTHERTEQPIMEGRTIVVEPGSMGSFVGRLDLTLGPDGGVTDHAFRLLPVRERDAPEDPAVARLVALAEAPFRARLDEVVARTAVPLLRYDVIESNLDNLIADAVREATGADVAFTNGFRFAPPVPAGPIREQDLWDMLPLDAPIKVGAVTGRQLREYLERELELVFSQEPSHLSGGWGPRPSGLTMTFAARAPTGSRLREVRVGGRPLDDAATYTLGGCDRPGEPVDTICRLRGTADARVLPVTIHGALRDYLRRHPVVSLRREQRAVAIDLPTQVFSQDEVLRAAHGH